MSSTLKEVKQKEQKTPNFSFIKHFLNLSMQQAHTVEDRDSEITKDMVPGFTGSQQSTLQNPNHLN